MCGRDRRKSENLRLFDGFEEILPRYGDSISQNCNFYEKFRKHVISQKICGFLISQTKPFLKNFADFFREQTIIKNFVGF